MSKHKKRKGLKNPAPANHAANIPQQDAENSNLYPDTNKQQRQSKKVNKKLLLNAGSDILVIEPYVQFLIVAAILLLAAAVYSNSLQNGFVQFDDPEIIVDNTSIRQFTWENFTEYFSSAPQFTFSPMVYVSLAIDYQIGQLNPFVYHLSSLLLHLASIALAYWLFQLLTGRWYMSALIAALFAVHPVNVDGISWLSTRSNVLYTFFYLASLLGYLYYLKTNYRLRYLICSLIFYICAVLSKSPAVVLPLILFLLDFYYERKLGQQRGRRWQINGRLFAEKVPYFLVAVVIGIITYHFHADIQHPYNYNLFDRFIVFCTALVGYCFKLLFPINLAFAYAYPPKIGDLLPLYCYLTPFVLIAIIWGCYKFVSSKKIMIFGLVFFLINIYLSQSTLFMDSFQANRYAYLPYLGLFFILADFHEQILRQADGWKSRLKYAWLALLVIVVGGFSYLTYERSSLWLNTLTIFDDTIKKEPNVPFTYLVRGLAKYKASDNDGALKDFERSSALDPGSYLSIYYQGKARLAMKDYQGAITDFTHALDMKIDYADIYYERANVKSELQDYAGALADYDTAIKYNPANAGYFNNRGIVKLDLKDLPGALADYSQALTLNPAFAEAYSNRSDIEIQTENYQAALQDGDRAIALSPNFGAAYYNRGQAKAGLKDRDGACADWRKALELGYSWAQAELNQSCQ